MSPTPNVSLPQALTSTKALTSHLLSSIRSHPPSSSSSSLPPTPSSPNALSLASTASVLLRSHTTKLTLLSLSQPFTPSAIATVLNEVSTGPLPALVAVVEVCSPDTYGKFLSTEVRGRISRLLVAWEGLLAEIPSSALEASNRNAKTERLAAESNANGSLGLVTGASRGGGGTGGKVDALRGTGLVWEACDALTTLGEKGLVWVAEKKMGEWKGLASDAIAELEEWLEGANEEDEGGGDGLDALRDRLEASGLESLSSSLSSLEDLGAKPTGEIRPLAKKSIKLLNHLALLYPPLIKRRIRRIRNVTASLEVEELPSQEVLARLHGMLELGRKVTEEADSLAESLYEGNQEEAKDKMTELVDLAKSETKMMEKTWDGKEDEFTAWLGKWSVMLEEIAAERPT